MAPQDRLALKRFHGHDRQQRDVGTMSAGTLNLEGLSCEGGKSEIREPVLYLSLAYSDDQT